MKRHLRRNASRTYCGRPLTGPSAVRHVADGVMRRPEDCYWCRVTLEAEERDKPEPTTIRRVREESGDEAALVEESS